MSNLPVVTVTGNATRDPEVRFTASGKAWTSFGVACTERRRNGDQWEDGETSFFDVVCYGQMAENVVESIRKGHRVSATGRCRVRKFEGKDGTPRTATEVVADEVAVSLRWARASVNKVPRDGGSATQVGSDPWSGGQPNDAPF